MAQLGICWCPNVGSTADQPNVEQNETSVTEYSILRQRYTFYLNNLRAGTDYRIRPFVRDNGGNVKYGNVKTVQTSTPEDFASVTPSAPEVAASQADWTISLSGTALTDNAVPVDEYGFIILSDDQKKPGPDSDRIPATLSADGQLFEATSNATKLKPKTRYYVYTYTVSELGFRASETGTGFTTPYSAEQLAHQPDITTLTDQQIEINRVTVQAQVTDDKGFPMSAYGFQWRSTANDFTEETWSLNSSDMDSEGNFTQSRRFDSPGTRYYRAFATNEYGTSYGEIQSITIADFSQYLPSQTTGTAKNTGLGEIEVQGTILSGNGYTVVERGFQYSQWSSLSSSDKKVASSGNGTGTIKAAIKELKPSTTYYYRTYARNLIGTSYGEVRQIRTDDSKKYLPDVSTQSWTEKGLGQVTTEGYIRSDNGYPILERGIQYREGYGISESDKMIKSSEQYGSNFRTTITGLKDRTSYTYRAYARNAAGTAYGQTRTYSFRIDDYLKDFWVDFSYRYVEFSARLTNTSSQQFRERGFCWTSSSYSDPTISNSKVKSNTSSSSSFAASVSFSTFASNTDYRGRAYVITDDGTVYYSTEVVRFNIGDE